MAEIDWSKAPKDADAWVFSEVGTCHWARKVSVEVASIDDGEPNYVPGWIAICGAPAFSTFDEMTAIERSENG